MTNLAQKKCIPCESGEPSVSLEKEQELIQQIPNWLLLNNDTHKLRRQFTFKDFKETMRFVNKVAEVAEIEGHHPDIYIFYNKVQIDLFTHAVGGLSENDFILAAKLDNISL